MHPLRAVFAIAVVPVTVPLTLAIGLGAASTVLIPTADLGFQPAENHEVTRDYGIQIDFELGDLTVIADGQDMSEMVPGDFEGTGELRLMEGAEATTILSPGRRSLGSSPGLRASSSLKRLALPRYFLAMPLRVSPLRTTCTTVPSRPGWPTVECSPG